MFGQIKNIVGWMSGSQHVEEHPILARRKPAPVSRIGQVGDEPVRVVQPPTGGGANAVKDLQEFLERNLPALR